MRKSEQEVNTGIAYILWALGIFGICGVHRLYLGKTVSGIIYLFTFGLFGLGQLMDLFFIPSMTTERNYLILGKFTARSLVDRTSIHKEYFNNKQTNISSFQEKKKEIDPTLKLLKAAAARNNVLSLGQAVILMEMPTEQVKALLNEAVKQDLAYVSNDPETGAIRYYFDI